MSPVAQVPVIRLVSAVLRHAVLYSNTYTRPVWAEAVQERPGSRDPQSHFGLLLQMEGLRGFDSARYAARMTIRSVKRKESP